MKNLEKFKVTELAQAELHQIEGGNFWDKVKEFVGAAIIWIDYQIRDYKDDELFNGSATHYF